MITVGKYDEYEFKKLRLYRYVRAAENDMNQCDHGHASRSKMMIIMMYHFAWCLLMVLKNKCLQEANCIRALPIRPLLTGLFR